MANPTAETVRKGKRYTMRVFDLPSIPSALAFRQEQYGWTQAQMAKKLGLQNSHYNEILKGKRMLPYKAACLAYKIGVPATVLLSLKNQRRVKLHPLNYPAPVSQLDQEHAV